MKLIDAVRGFAGKRILVVGDLIMDRFVTGRVRRISPEAPVPVVEVTKEEYMPGGAGNVAANIMSLGGAISLVSAVGSDLPGRELLKILRSTGADTGGIILDRDRPTSLKTRIIAEHQQVVRADWESRSELSDRLTERLISKSSTLVEKCDGVVISDYGKGLLSSALISALISEAESRKLPVVVDPQVGHFFDYRRVTSLTPNTAEAGAALGVEITGEESLLEAGRRLLSELESRTILITRGEEGMSLFYSDGRVEHIPTVAREVYDVTGAGDTVSGVFTLALSGGLGFSEAAHLANFAAAVVVGKLGTATVTQNELIAEMERRV